MAREFSDNLKKLTSGLREVEQPNSLESYCIGQKYLFVINNQGQKVNGGRMPYELKQGIVMSKNGQRSRKNKKEPSPALSVRVTDSGEENQGLTPKPTPRGSSFFYENIITAYETK